MIQGGAALGFYHVGVVKALMENGLLPRVISGASAGSVLAAMIGTRTDDECRLDLFNLQGTTTQGHSGKLMLDFFRPLPRCTEITSHDHNHGSEIRELYVNTAGWFHDGKRTFQLLLPIGIRNFSSFIYDILIGHRRPKDMLKNDTAWFRSCCAANIGDMTFQEAFDRTGRILNIIVSPQNRSDPPRLLNYLTAPHVIVWSAAVASSSLPGVFEPNKLLVKNADGSTRYESALGAGFIDGSMEADLPMQQLSEMFNINHFIISQANPHAVFLASFNRNQSVWSHGLFTFLHGVLVFLKKQVKAWIGSMIELIGAQRAAPIWDTRRGFASQFFTQEYEGRETDITLVPWANHRSMLSALLHVLYNPSEAEFRDWIHAAERETWRYIPKIKSHVAEEITLDQCVQRLRKQLILESLESRQPTEATNTLSNRVPSFFTSPSLVNLSGLAITDPYNKSKSFENGVVFNTANERVGDYDVGWKGMGLKGNFSSGSLNRSSGSLPRSSSSGIFPLDEDENISTAAFVHNLSSLPLSQKQMSDPLIQSSDRAYIKTTSMANFYYKNALGLGHKPPPLENQDSFYADTHDSIVRPNTKCESSQDQSLTLDQMSV